MCFNWHILFHCISIPQSIYLFSSNWLLFWNNKYIGHDFLCTCKRIVLGHLSVNHILTNGVLDCIRLQFYQFLPSPPCNARQCQALKMMSVNKRLFLLWWNLHSTEGRIQIRSCMHTVSHILTHFLKFLLIW